MINKILLAIASMAVLTPDQHLCSDPRGKKWSMDHGQFHDLSEPSLPPSRYELPPRQRARERHFGSSKFKVNYIFSTIFSLKVI